MPEKDLRIAFSGPSGLGKTTLATEVHKKLNFVHPSTSAGRVMTDKDKSYLLENFGYEGAGHRNVINLSGANPDFGIEFQRILLERRIAQMRELYNKGFILDRCPIDNIAYILSQVGHNLKEDRFENFLGQAVEAYSLLTHLIIIKYSPDIPWIEDNNSRVPNRYFQKYISDVFMGVYHRYFAQIVGPRVMVIDFWDLKQRTNTVLNFIKE